MLNPTNNSTTIDLLNDISSQINRYMTLVVFLLGTIGNLLNALVLSQPVLRVNPCVIYFLGSSASNLGALLIGLPTRIMGGWSSRDPSNIISWLCKMRIFFLYTFRTTSAWLIVLASVDRWLSSSVLLERRRLSSRENAYRAIITISLLSSILWIQSIFCYDADLIQSPLQCYGKSNFCRLFNDLTYASITVTIPSFLMLILGLLTINNVRRWGQTIQPFMAPVTVANLNNLPNNNNRKRRRIRRSERSLTRMLFIQVILLTLVSLPQAIQQFYLSATIQVIKSPLHRAIENLIVNFDLSLNYVGNCIPFYVYTLTGTVFRRTLIRLFRSITQQFNQYLYAELYPLRNCRQLIRAYEF